jgi:alkanesulfonate monooxygenase SsuD/methylene tetrahydromethanopterin reductase-like flavin-dependent oxidoreductase (luciferase family)
MALIALRYDLRSPAWAATPHPELYRACLEQAAWGDQLGLTALTLSEHHGWEDGYMSAPFTLAAAVAARTERIAITIAAALLPLHDPIRLAEQIATVDLIARGRVNFVAGAGYADHEFDMAGVEKKRRGKMLEEAIEVMRRAWTGEPFEWQGRTIRVTPTPVTKPHPMILIGGSSEAAARRAARLRLPFFPAIGDPHLAEVYQRECEAVGHTPFVLMPSGPGFVHVTEDPEKAWAQIGPYALYDAESYREMQSGGTRSQVLSKAQSVEELKAEGIYQVLTPDECVALAEALGPMGSIVLHPLLCGMPVELGWESLELFKEKVLPRIS